MNLTDKSDVITSNTSIESDFFLGLHSDYRGILVAQKGYSRAISPAALSVRVSRQVIGTQPFASKGKICS
jgi:hypothetical protein